MKTAKKFEVILDPYSPMGRSVGETDRLVEAQRMEREENECWTVTRAYVREDRPGNCDRCGERTSQIFHVGDQQCCLQCAMRK